MRRTGGFTLVEVMVVVAVVGILAGIAIVAFDKPANRVKTTSEVSAMFAEFHRAEGQYALENGVYYSTGTSSGSIYPSTPTAQLQTITMPASWTTLRIDPISTKLRCGYVAVAGTATDNLPDFAVTNGMVRPSGNWYALYARCNADGRSAVDATYFASSVDATLVKQNEGR